MTNPAQDVSRGNGTSNQSQRPSLNPEGRKLPAQVDACLNLVSKCLLEGDTDSADMWLDIMARELPGSSSKAFFHSLIHVCAKSGSPNAAGWCAVRMVRAGLQPNKVTFNSVIDACAKVGQIDLATKWWEEMTQIGLKPNAITYNTMINACAQARDAGHAEWWMQKMLKDNVTPCIVSFSTVIDAFAKTGRLDRAEGWFARMNEAGVAPDAVIYNSLINACAKAGNPSKAEYWLLQMQISHLEPDEKTYNSIINACAKAGATERAEHWFKHMERAGCRVDKITFGSVIHASAKIGNVERAEDWLEEMIRRGMTPNLVCFNTVLHACAHNGDTARAMGWFNKILAMDIDPNKITYNSMIHAFAKAGDAASAEGWLRQMISKGYYPDQITYVTLLRACMQTGEDFSSWAYGTIIKAFAHVGNVNSMKRWLGDMTRAGMQPSRELCDAILQICAKSGDRSLVTQVTKLLNPHKSRRMPEKPAHGIQLTQPELRELRQQNREQRERRQHNRELAVLRQQQQPEAPAPFSTDNFTIAAPLQPGPVPSTKPMQSSSLPATQEQIEQLVLQNIRQNAALQTAQLQTAALQDALALTQRSGSLQRSAQQSTTTLGNPQGVQGLQELQCLRGFGYPQASSPNGRSRSSISDAQQLQTMFDLSSGKGSSAIMPFNQASKGTRQPSYMSQAIGLPESLLTREINPNVVLPSPYPVDSLHFEHMSL